MTSEDILPPSLADLIELDVEDRSQLDAMCQKLLVNPLIEDYEVLDAS